MPVYLASTHKLGSQKLCTDCVPPAACLCSFTQVDAFGAGTEAARDNARQASLASDAAGQPGVGIGRAAQRGAGPLEQKVRGGLSY